MTAALSGRSSTHAPAPAEAGAGAVELTPLLCRTCSKPLITPERKRGECGECEYRRKNPPSKANVRNTGKEYR